MCDIYRDMCGDNKWYIGYDMQKVKWTAYFAQPRLYNLNSISETWKMENKKPEPIIWVASQHRR